jgi:hypothetical protein
VIGVLASLALLLTALTGCASPGDAAAEPAPTYTATARAPQAPAVVLPAAAPETLAVQASRAFFDAAPVALVAPVDEPGAQLAGASLAVAAGLPVLLAGRAGLGPEAEAELARLGTGTVLTVGAVPGLAPADPREEGGEPAATPTGPAFHVVPVPPDAGTLAAALGNGLAATTVPAGGEVAAIAALDPAAPTLLLPAAAAPSPTASPGPSPTAVPGFPALAPTRRVSGVTVLSDGAPGQLAAVGTAAAAGADVLVVPGGDPRGSSAAIRTLAAAPADPVVALGPAFGGDDDLGWRVATARTGVELPGGTQLVFPGNTMNVALYGTPGSAALGVLGEQGVPETIARAREHAAAFEPYTDDVVVPSLEIIATIASGGPGPDGNYSAERGVTELRPLIDAAREAGLYVVLDLQPGRTDFLTQARQYEELLREPHVGLALDPEWRLAPGQVHLRQIGSVDIAEVNQVVTYLADLTRANRLPQKLLVLHQFRASMLRDRARLDTSRSELAITIHVDGQGTQPEKAATWGRLLLDAPPVHWGWKNFYDEDSPMLTPAQTMQIVPTPDLVTYQ